MTTIKDVAAHCGMSPATVSRVLNGYKRISPETRARVEKAIRELDYQPDELARRMKQETSPLIGIIVPDITNPFYSSIARGAQRAAEKADYTVLLCDTNNSSKQEKRSVSLLNRYRAAGIISASIAPEAVANDIYSGQDNVVFIDNIPALQQDYSYVTINNYTATCKLVQKLLDAGCKNLCMIAGPESESSFADRLRGYQDTLSAAGLINAPETIQFGDCTIDSGAEKMKAILDSGYRPDAVFAANNFMAYGAAQVLADAGFKVPRDIKIATFDVFDSTHLIDNRFIYVSQPATDIGFIAAKTCIERDQNKDSSTASCKHILEYSIHD